MEELLFVLPVAMCHWYKKKIKIQIHFLKVDDFQTNLVNVLLPYDHSWHTGSESLIYGYVRPLCLIGVTMMRGSLEKKMSPGRRKFENPCAHIQ